MLNYIWAGLIVSSFVFALGYDVGDINADRYRNGQPLPVTLALPEGYDSAARRIPVEIRIHPAQYTSFYRTEQAPAASYPGYLLQAREGTQLRFAAGVKLPEPLATIGKVSKSRDEELQGRLVGFKPTPATATAGVVFEPVRFAKLNAIGGPVSCARARGNSGGYHGADMTSHFFRYSSLLRYLSPESAISVTTVAPRPSRSPTCIAAMTFAPDDVPAKSASSRARRLAISFASSVLTATISSTRAGSQSGGVYPIPTPSIP